MYGKLMVIVPLLIFVMLSSSTQVSFAYAGAISSNSSGGGLLNLRGSIDVQSLSAGRSPSTHLSVPLQTRSSGEPDQSNLPGTFAGVSTSQDIKIQLAFNGLSLADEASITGIILTPPDVQVAAGPSNIMEMVNVAGEIFTKQGTIIANFGLDSFFLTGPDFISDPKVLFDSISNRWFASIVDVSTNTVVLAVSTTNDASASFCIFSISASPNLPDQPIIGVSNDKFVVSANDFTPTRAGFSFAGAQFWVLNKSQLLSCSTTVDFVSFGPDPSVFSVHPVQSLTSTTTEFMVSAASAPTGGAILLYSVIGVPPSVTVSRTALSVSSIRSPPSANQLGSTFKLDTGDFRVQDAFWSNSKLWLAHNNRCVPTGDRIARSCIHLVEIDTSTTSVVQDFNFGAAGQYFFYPALRQDGSGNLLLISGFSSASNFPGLKVTEQATTDASGTLESPLLLQAGLGPVELTFGCSATACRYGDYFGAGVDPSNPSIVWVAGEFGSGTSSFGFGGEWTTEIGSITG